MVRAAERKLQNYTYSLLIALTELFYGAPSFTIIYTHSSHLVHYAVIRACFKKKRSFKIASFRPFTLPSRIASVLTSFTYMSVVGDGIT